MIDDAARAAILADLKRDEGLQLKPYKDAAGKLTVGYGVNLDAGIDATEADWLLGHREAKAEEAVVAYLPWTAALDPGRHSVLVEMAYNLGIEGLLGFRHTLDAVHEGRWADAAAGMRASLWARQIGARAERLAVKMETGAIA